MGRHVVGGVDRMSRFCVVRGESAKRERQGGARGVDGINSLGKAGSLGNVLVRKNEKMGNYSGGCRRIEGAALAALAVLAELWAGLAVRGVSLPPGPRQATDCQQTGQPQRT